MFFKNGGYYFRWYIDIYLKLINFSGCFLFVVDIWWFFGSVFEIIKIGLENNYWMFSLWKVGYNFFFN